ncbi:uncharacterized protein [Cherax quadricarinatus]
MKQQQQNFGGGSSRINPRVLQWERPKPLLPIPQKNYAIFMLEIMEKYGDAVAVVDAETYKRRTYRELCGLVPRVSAGLAAAGVTMGDIVLFLTPTHMDYPLVFLSIVHRGAVCVPINPTLTLDELVHVLKVSQARWAVVHEASVTMAEEAFSCLPSHTLKKMWVLGHTSLERPNLEDLMTYTPSSPITQTENLDTKKMACLMLFSSGTTGLPKGVMLSHRNIIVSNLRYMCEASAIPPGTMTYETRFKVVLLVIPVCHSYGHIMLHLCLQFGGTTVFVQSFSARKFLQTIQNFKVTYCPIVPHLAKSLAEMPFLKHYDISSIVSFNSSGALLPTATVTSFEEKVGRSLAIGYGMTETSAMISSTRISINYNIGSVGRVVPYVQVKIVDVESGEMLGEHQEGEICVKGPNVMLGYANDPVATAATIDPQGWLHTGDIGYYNQDNFIFLTDRMKDLIKVKGFQVSPTELENVIMKCEDVADVAVVGVPHDRMGEAPLAFVVLKPGSKLQPHQLMQFVADRVSHYKQLAGGVKMVKSIPRNSSGKVLRRQLKKDVLSPAAKL